MKRYYCGLKEWRVGAILRNLLLTFTSDVHRMISLVTVLRVIFHVLA